MTRAKIRNGKRWIKETTKRVAVENRQSIDNLKWRIGNKGFVNGMYSLMFFIGKIHYVEIFSEDDLSDLPKSLDIKVKVESRLRALMKSIGSETRKKSEKSWTSKERRISLDL